MSLFADVESGNVEAVRAEVTRLKALGTDGLAELHQKLIEVNGSGKTLLHIAAQTGRIEMVRLLMDLDVALDIRDSEGHKPSNLAAQRANDTNITEAQKHAFNEVAALLRTREAWQGMSTGFRFNKVVDMIEKAIPAVEEGTNKNKVLLIGRTGAGKSSFLNYANGSRYTIEDDVEAGSKSVKWIGGNPEIARVGVGVISETLYPQIVQIPGQDFVFCDLAGLVDNRGNEQRIVAASSTQILAKLPGNIKALGVVLDAPSFQPRGQEFRGTLLALSQILNGNPALMSSVYFIITKSTPGVTVEGLIRRFIKPISQELENVRRQRNLTDEEERLDAVLKFMLENRNRILIPNVFDDGLSYRMIKDEIARAILQPADTFNFTRHDSSQNEFNGVLETIGREYNQRRHRIDREIPDLIAAETAKQREEDANIVRWQTEIDERRLEMNQPYDPSRLDAQIAAKNQEITNNNAAITAQTAIINTKTAELASYRGELNQLNTEADIQLTENIPPPFSHTGESYRNVLIFIPFGPERPVKGESEHNFNWNASYPLSRVVANQSHGTWSTFDWHEGRNDIVATYRYPRGVTCNASLSLYAKQRVINAARIVQLNQLIAPLQPQIDAASTQRASLETRNNTLRNEIQICQTEKIQGRADVDVRNHRLANEIEIREAWINGRAAQEARPASGNNPAQEGRPSIVGAVQKRDAAIQTQRNLQKERVDLEIELHVNTDLFATVARVVKILQLNKPDLTRLLADYPTQATNINNTSVAHIAAARGLFANNNATQPAASSSSSSADNLPHNRM